MIERTPEQFRIEQTRRLAKRSKSKAVRTPRRAQNKPGAIIAKVRPVKPWRTYDRPGPLTVRKIDEAGERGRGLTQGEPFVDSRRLAPAVRESMRLGQEAPPAP